MFTTKLFGASVEERKQYFIAKVNSLHPNCYDFSKVNYVNKDTRVELVCRKCGDTCLVLPSLFNQKNDKVGCQKCNIKKRASKRRLSKSVIQSRLNQNWTVLNWDNHASMESYLSVQCKICNIVHSCMVNNLVRGLGCYNCYNKRRGDSLRLAQDVVIEKFVQIWGSEYDYSMVKYVSMWTKVEIKCKLHGCFHVAPHDHIDRIGCKQCSKKMCSKMQIDWIKFMEVRYSTEIQHAFCETGEYKIPSTRYKADGYSEKLHTIFEFHGDFYHGNPKFYNRNDVNTVCKKTFGELYRKTCEKQQKIVDLGYNLVTIWEYQWKIFIKSVKKIKSNYKLRKARSQMV